MVLLFDCFVVLLRKSLRKDCCSKAKKYSTKVSFSQLSLFWRSFEAFNNRCGVYINPSYRKSLDKKKVLIALVFDIKEVFNLTKEKKAQKTFVGAKYFFAPYLMGIFVFSRSESSNPAKQIHKNPGRDLNRSITKIASYTYFIHIIYCFSVQNIIR